MINYVLKEYIDRIVVVYLDNIFIFSKILEEYKEYIHFILTTLEQANLYINIYKSIFYSQKIDYLRFKIRLKIIKMNDKKIEIIRFWLQFINIKKIRRFFKFANFYRHFIERLRQLTILFIKLIKNDKA